MHKGAVVFRALLLGAFACGACPAQTMGQQAGYREFRDRGDRVIQARVLRVSGDVVTIERKDGKQFTVPLAVFSQADQDYIRRSAERATPAAVRDNWPRFRGSNGSGAADAKDLPLDWNANRNIVWRTALPGPGASSPVIWGDRIYVTCYSGYGIPGEPPGEKGNLVRHLVCVDRNEGRILWDTKTRSRHEVADYGSFVALHGFASSTPACDGERVSCFYGCSGVYAFDLTGREQWNADVGTGTHGFGTGASVLLHDNLVIVNACVESGSVVALDKQTGREVWRASGIKESWNTPVLVDVAGRRELVVDSDDSLRAFDPATGRELWRSAGSQPPRYLCPSPIVHDGIVYAVHGFHGPMSAIRPGGSGDVTESHRLWVRPRVGTNVPSPVYCDGYVFSVREDGGVVTCVSAKDGEVVFEKRLEPSPGLIYASPLAADGKIYLVSREEGAYVLAAGPEFQQLAHNVIEDDKSIFHGSPVPDGSRLLLRSDKFLYCIGE